MPPVGPRGQQRTFSEGSLDGLERGDATLRSCEAKLVSFIRKHWALDFGSREVRLVIEYQDHLPVLIRVTENVVKEEKLK